VNKEDKYTYIIYKEICYLVAGSQKLREIVNEKVAQIFNCPKTTNFGIMEVGKKMDTTPEIALSKFEHYAKTDEKYKRIIAIDKATKHIVEMFYGDYIYGERFAEAIIESCKDLRGRNFNVLDRKYKLYCSPRTFYNYKRKFVFDIAERLGYL
jgi:hypothetical protein